MSVRRFVTLHKTLGVCVAVSKRQAGRGATRMTSAASGGRLVKKEKEG
jgi:hypothetical protein